MLLTTALGFPGGSVVKNPPPMQKTWVQSLGWEDSLEKEMVTHCGTHSGTRLVGTRLENPMDREAW